MNYHFNKLKKETQMMNKCLLSIQEIVHLILQKEMKYMNLLKNKLIKIIQIQLKLHYGVIQYNNVMIT